MKKESNLVDHLTLVFFGLFSGSISRKTREEQYRKNREAWAEYISRQTGRMLEKQSELSAFSYGRTARLWEKLFLGGAPLTAAVNSCEVIAVYNALVYLKERDRFLTMDEEEKSEKEQKALYDPTEKGKKTSADAPDFPALLKQFSGRGICANGLFGTSPGAVERYFTKQGYKVIRYAGGQITEPAMVHLAEITKVCILTSFNRGQDPFSMVHTMCVTKEKNCWRLHNDGEGGKVYPTLHAAVWGYNGRKSHPIKVMGILTDEDSMDYCGDAAEEAEE